MADTEHQMAPVDEGDAMSNGLSNGISNGTSEHKDKDHKHKHKDKDREREKDKDRHRDKDKDKDRHKSSHKDKEREKDRHKSSHREKETEEERKIRKEKERKEREEKDKNKDHKSSHREKETEEERKIRKDKERKEREEKDKNKDHDKDKERSKDKDRHKSSHREKETEEERRIRKEKEKERSKDKDRHNKSSHREKETEEERRIRKEKERKDKEKREKEKKEGEIKIEIKSEHKIKEEIKSEPADVSVKEEPAESEEEDKLIISEPPPVKEEPQDEDDLPLASRGKEEQDSIKEEEEEEEEEQQQEEEEEEYKPDVKEEQDDSEDDLPLSARKRVKEESDDDDLPLASRKKAKAEPKKKRKKKGDDEDDEEDEDFKPGPKKKKQKVKKEGYEDDFKPEKKKAKKEKFKIKPKKEKKELWAKTKVRGEMGSPTKKQLKQQEEEANVWKWWEEEKKDDGTKWNYLEHKGPVFADPYIRVPKSVKFLYKGEHMILSDTAEEVAGFYARMLEHDYCTKEVFNNNFFKDWRKQMNQEEREKITKLSHCDFRQLHAYYVDQNEQRKQRSKEEKKALKEKNEELVKEYGWCNIDGHKQRIGNFKIEPPGLFRGRGEHPKQGMLKTRIEAEDVSINCSKDSDIPEPPPGHKWKNVRHDNSVTWLACWVENVQGQTKYVMLNAASKLKGEKDWQKYETARRLHQIAEKIRENYRADFKSKEMRVRQRSVAMYFIDKLALRAGNEKDEDQADTVGCCSLRVEHIQLIEEKDGKEFVVVFDFLGKDSIRYYNEVPVEKRVFKNLQLFVENKNGGDDLFDRLNTASLNKHLNELMEGLTAKVFRTYNASRTLQEQLNKGTDPDDSIPAKILSYNRANREVAILCNHQRAAPKTFDKSMENLKAKIDTKRDQVEEAERQLKDAKKAAKSGSAGAKMVFEKKKKALERISEQFVKLELSATDKEENKTIALGTSKLNYLDPRISVAWAKKYDVPVEKVYNKTQRSKFQWAIDMATADYNFMGEPMAMPSKVNTSQSQDEDDDGGDEDYE
ncbi:unnamed protein product [Meganyctiphanes norvegica]|uniref:DNA topoisomerase I n=1 Tax=Meganyctiphanes norvegica TaxID=48144 RepID=A0AAV2RV01_MEGNR